MVSYEAKLPNQEEDDLARLYGRETFGLVCEGYRRINSYFDTVKARGGSRVTFSKKCCINYLQYLLCSVQRSMNGS